MGEIKVLIADASPLYKNIFEQAVSETIPDASVTCASNAEESLLKIRRNDFDIVVVDADISKTGLLGFLLEAIREIPKAAILITARPCSVKHSLFADAVAKSAAYVMIKPIYSNYDDNFAAAKSKLADVMNVIRERREKNKTRPGVSAVSPHSAAAKRDVRPELVLIAASTGGPPALENILTSLKESFPVPILVVQHMLPRFTETLASDLDKKSKLKVKVAQSGEFAEAGTIYLAPGGLHMKLSAEKQILLDDSPPVNGVRPAADALFMSIADARQWDGILAVILTGMGRDGEKGLARLKEKQSCFCLTQSERTCVVYGMPRAAMEGGLVDMVLDLDDIAGEVESFNFANAPRS